MVPLMRQQDFKSHCFIVYPNQSARGEPGEREAKPNSTIPDF